MLHEYLKYAYSCWHHGGLLPVSSTDRVFESPFEEAVYNQLESLGGKFILSLEWEDIELIWLLSIQRNLGRT